MRYYCVCHIKRFPKRRKHDWVGRWVDRLLPIVYENEPFSGKNMGLVHFLSHHAIGAAAKTTQLDKKFAVAQFNGISRLIAPLA